jgi:hypothetical protein
MMNWHVKGGFAVLAVAAALIGCAGQASAQSAQAHVHDSAHTVMPFDISKTVHVFRMTDQGGVQRVLIRDPSYKEQVPFIQQHLKHEAERFQVGNYSDPGMLHGSEMPGLDDLRAGASHIRVAYAALPDGAEISFTTEDRHLLTAIHRWFGAQLSEHGADAKAE